MGTTGAKTDHLHWDELRTALFLARGRSVRHAARTLGVSHSTVLRRIADLEKSAGVRLFDKTGDGYELTTAGQDVFDTAKNLEEIVSGLERRVYGRDLALSGAVRVTLPDPMLPPLLPVFRDFARSHPEIAVTLAVGTTFADLAHREADIAIRVASEPPPELVGRRVVKAGVGIYGRSRYLRKRAIEDLASLDWVVWQPGSESMFARWMDKHVRSARIALRITEVAAVRDAVDAGVGVAILPCAFAEGRPGWQRVALLPELATPL